MSHYKKFPMAATMKAVFAKEVLCNTLGKLRCEMDPKSYMGSSKAELSNTCTQYIGK